MKEVSGGMTTAKGIKKKASRLCERLWGRVEFNGTAEAVP
jgi:hypothetical protein